MESNKIFKNSIFFDTDPMSSIVDDPFLYSFIKNNQIKKYEKNKNKINNVCKIFLKNNKFYNEYTKELIPDETKKNKFIKKN